MIAGCRWTPPPSPVIRCELELSSYDMAMRMLEREHAKRRSRQLALALLVSPILRHRRADRCGTFTQAADLDANRAGLIEG